MDANSFHWAAPGDDLSALAQRVRAGDVTVQSELRHRLTDALMPIIGLALRRGVGMPALVNWARQAAGGLHPEAAPAVANLLCTALLRQLCEQRPPSTPHGVAVRA